MSSHATHLLHLLTATFDLPLRGHEISQWRGAFAQLAGIGRELFHNHDNNADSLPETPGISQDGTENQSVAASGKFHYRYPHIQYRAQRGKATIFAVNEGIASLQEVLATTNWEIEWNGVPYKLQLQSLDMKDHYLQLTKSTQAFHLRNWLPFNDKNHEKWLSLPNLKARIDLLEGTLAGQLIAFCGDVGWRIPARFDVTLQHIHSSHQMQCHGISRISLNATFSTNLLLPTGIALGKCVSHGFGCLWHD